MNFKASYTFRLSIPLAIGIAVGDLLTLPIAFFLLLLALAVVVISFRRDHTLFRQYYGAGIAGVMLFLGSTLYLLECRATAVDWPPRATTYRGWLTDRPVKKKNHLRCRMEVEGHEVMLYLPDDSLGRTLGRGDELLFQSCIRCPDTSRYAHTLFYQGISGSGFTKAGRWRPTGYRHPLTFRQQALACRDRLVDVYRSWGLQGDRLAVLSALTLGVTDELSTELRNDFSAAGISHVLALSGLHVGLIWALLASFWPSYLPRRRQRLLRWSVVSLLLIGYAFLAGLPPSAVRAVAMCMLWEANECISSEYTPRMHALLAVVLVMLCVRPFYLFQLSFQLSVMAVGGILAFYEPLEEIAHRYVGRQSRRLSNLLVPIIAQCTVAPITLYYFHTFPVYFLAGSFLAVWLAEGIVGLALALLLLATVFGRISWGVGLLDGMLGGLTLLAHYVGRLPHATWHTSGLTGWEVAYLYAYLILFYRWISSPTRRRGLILLCASSGTLAILLF